MMTADEIIQSASTLRDFARMSIAMDETCEHLADTMPKYATPWRAISRRVQAGDPLSLQLAEHGLWPAGPLAAVEAGEMTGNLAATLNNVVKFQKDTKTVMKAVSNKVVTPAIFSLIGVLIFCFYMIALIPVVTKNIKTDREGMLAVSDAMAAAWSNHSVMILATLGAFVFGLIALSRTDGFRRSAMRVIDRIPAIGTGLREIYLGFWCDFMVILDSAGDISYSDMVRTASLAIPEVYRPAMYRLIEDSEGAAGLAGASDPKLYEPDDPRKRWPILFTAGLAASAKSGSTSLALAQVSESLIESGQNLVARGLVLLNALGIALAATGILMPMAIMLMAQFDNVNALK